MNSRTLVYYPNPIFRQKCTPVTQVNADIVSILYNMLAVVRAHSGLGMGAVQIGVLQRLVVVETIEGSTSQPILMVNPEILWVSDEKDIAQEGNLSMPHIYEMIERPSAIKVQYLEENGAQHILDASGLLARVIQHEVDHLNGVLFIDYLSKLKRDRILKKYQKISNANL